MKALIKTAIQHDFDMRILNAVEVVNEDQKSLLFEKARTYFNDNLKGKSIAIWGLSFR